MSPGALYTAFASTARERRDRPAFTFLDARGAARSYTYGQLFNASERIGAAMSQRGLNDRTAPLGLLLRTQEDQTLHYLAALGQGAIPAVLTPPNPKLNRAYYDETMRKVLRRSRFSAIITDLELEDPPAPAFAAHTLEPLAAADVAPPRDASPQIDASFLQFSSGTTGIKRGVLVTDEAVLAQLHGYADALGLGDHDRILSWLPLYHDMGFIACLNMPLFFGIHTVVIDPIDWVSRPSLFVRAASEFSATLSWNPNFAYAFMAQRIRARDMEGVDLSSLRGLVNCSEPVTHSSQQQFLERFGPHGLRDDVFMGCYAMAETTFALTHGESSVPDALDHDGPTNAARAAETGPYVSVGRPLEGVVLEVVDDHGRPRPDREIGEVWVRAPFNFAGYFGDEEATREAFSGDWYRTGDLGYRVGEALYITGRKKDVLIVGGVNVFPGDLEAVATEVPGIHPGRAAAFAAFDPRLQTERITVLAESDLEDDPAGAAVLEIRQRLLSAFQIANFDVHLVPPGWLVKSSSGKMARRASQEKWTRMSAPGAGTEDHAVG